MISFSYSHLRYFWAAAKAGSLSRAAKELHVSQPALSLQLRTLETALGAKLVRRGPRGIALTPEGRKAFARAERIFAEGEALAAELRGDSAPRPIRFGVERSVAREVILRAAASLREHGALSIFTASSGDLVARLLRGELDLALTDEDLGPSLGPGFSSTLAGMLPLSLVAAPSLARAKVLPMLLRPRGKAVRTETERFLTEKGYKFQVMAESDDIQLLRGLACQGLGAACLSVPVMGRDLDRGRLIKLRSMPIREHVWLTAAAPSRRLLEKLVLDIPGRP